MTESSSANQRQHDRYSTDFLVSVDIVEDDGPRQGKCLNLSMGGLFIAMDPPLPRGTRVKLQLRLEPSGVSIYTEALVCWTRPKMPDPQFPPGVGVKFLDLAEKDKQTLAQTIESLKDRPSTS